MRPFLPLLLEPLTSRLGWTLLHFVWQGAALAALLALLLILLRHGSASARYLACCVVLLLMTLCPPVTFWILAPRPLHTTGPRHETPSFQPSPTDFVREPAPKPLSVSYPDTAKATGSLFFVGKRPTRLLLERLLPWLVLGWGGGVLLLCLRLAGSALILYRLTRRGTHPISGWLDTRLQELARQMQVRRPVRLLESSRVQVPTVIGCVRAVVLLPVTTLTGLPPQQIEALLAHELAHIGRHDPLVNLWQVTVETLLFYHPAVWWVSRQMRTEREQCCDDKVVEVLNNRVVYARALASLETLRSREAPLALAGDGGDLLARIRHILGLAPVPERATPFSLAGVILSAALLMSFLAWQTPAIPQSGSINGGNKTPSVESSHPDAHRIPAPVLLALTQARDHYQSLTSFSMRIENHYTSGLFPTEYSQELRWRKPDQFELIVTSKNKSAVPDYYADGEQLIMIQPDGRQKMSAIKPEPNTSPGWEVSVGMILSWLQNTESAHMERLPLPLSYHFSIGPRTTWRGYHVRELLMKDAEHSRYYPHGIATSFFLDSTQPKLIGMETDALHRVGWALYADQKENPVLPKTLGQAPPAQ